MKYLKTTKATSWDKEVSLAEKILKLIFWFIPNPNRENEKKYHLLNEWYIEFNEDDEPLREIGIDKDGNPILASGAGIYGLGFWLDTDMHYNDFLDKESSVISEEEFKKMWNLFRLST